LREIIEAKVQGREIVAAAEESRPVADIMTALKESIERARTKRQPMVKATGKSGKEAPAARQPRARKRG
jgi:non-homologous end joining protein Ku